jgi:hypothetical protein
MIVVLEWSNNKPFKAICINGFKCKTFNFWNNSKTIHEIYEVEKNFKCYLEDQNKILIVGYKDFIDYFGILSRPIVYDYHINGDIKDIIKFLLSNSVCLFKEWQLFRSQAAEVYHKLENRGIFFEYKKVFPKYKMDVFSGRSKTLGFNIQGTNKNWNLKHVNSNYNIFVNIDWIAADARIGSLLSEDKVFNDSFLNSDPYTYIENYLGNKVSRDVCKIEFNRAVNSLSDRSGILNIFPRFKEWINEKKAELDNKGFVESILGRRFYTDHSQKSDRRVFNGILQGSVAHAMNNVLFLIDREFSDIILTEQHDSLTVCTNNILLPDIIKGVVKIMMEPFVGVFDKRIIMPLRVSIGKEWGNYKFFKEYR